MTSRTRYFVIASLLILTVGLGTGLVAYYVGFPAGAFAGHGGPDELRLLPRTAAIVAHAEVREVMTSDLRQRIRRAMAERVQEDGQREFENATGINIETDIDSIVACLDPNPAGSQAGRPGDGLVIARGLFDQTKIELLMRDHGAQVEEYKTKRLVTAQNGNDFSLAFIEPGLIAVGSTRLVRQAVDLHTAGGDSAATNDELMAQIRALDEGNAWAVGRLDVLRSTSKFNLPPAVANQVPPISWFSVTARVDSGLRGALRAEANDEVAANNLRDVVRGFVGLARLQVGSKPEYQTLVQSLQLGGTGKTVSLTFDVPGEVFDLIGTALPKPPEGR